MHNESHIAERRRGISLRALPSRMRHDGGPRRAGRVVLERVARD
jgi:hypothetical protein